MELFVECICEGIPFDLCSPLGKRNVWRSGAVRARGLEAAGMHMVCWNYTTARW